MIHPRRSILCATIVAMAMAAAGITGTASESAIESDEPVTLPAEPIQPARQPGTLARIWNWSDARVRGIFDEILPDTQARRSWRFSMQPHLRDLLDHDHLRTAIGATYGFNRRAEGEFEVDTYVGNPFEERDSSVRGSGIANYRGNFKYQWRPWFDQKTRSASGLSVVRPNPGSPDYLNQGINRYSIYSTFARPAVLHPNLEGFLNVSYDLITPSSAGGSIPEDEPQDDFVRLGTGALYRTGALTYGFSVSWAHTVDNGTEDFFTVTPSIIYDVPTKYTFNGPGRWQIGAALEGKQWGDETDLNLRLRVRWFVDIKGVYKNWKESRAAARQASARGDER